MKKFFILLVLIAVTATGYSDAEVIKREGKGYLEQIDGYRVLHLKGTPYEMGYQHGVLMRDHIQQIIQFLLYQKMDGAKEKVAGNIVDVRRLLSGLCFDMQKYIPEKYQREMKGVADGAQVPLHEIYQVNIIPELFHCSGFALLKQTTADSTVFHGRILDYATDWRLQEHSVLIVQQPDKGNAFVNVSYAGFIGSVTGMNAEKIAIGEMGGNGQGHWEGMPMSFLFRKALEESDSLDDAVAVFRDTPRTCEYYYIISDGNTNQAAFIAATWETFNVAYPGDNFPGLPQRIPQVVYMSGGKRYKELARRIKKGWGSFTAESAIRLMDPPVAMRSCLQAVLFEPTTTNLWVANASKEGQNATTQKYHQFNLLKLLAVE